MARSVFYYHIRRKSSDRHDLDRKAVAQIYHSHKGRYGYRRVTLEMRNHGFSTNHKVVLRLMNEQGLRCRVRKVRYRSYKGDIGKTAPNIINRDFSALRPNEKWATDITQISIGGDKLYLSPILDMFNGEIISYSLSRSPNMAQINDMLDKAFMRFNRLDGLVIHSDQGWQYQHYTYRKRLKEHGIIQSMSRKGNCLDNAVMENFFGIMKSELLYLQHWDGIEQFSEALKEYIRYYNNDRIKLRLNGRSPVQYRASYRFA